MRIRSHTLPQSSSIYMCMYVHTQSMRRLSRLWYVMAAGRSNETTKVLLTVWGEQNIQNQLDGVVQNNECCV